MTDPAPRPTPGAALRALVDAQADDAGLWFIAHHATEEYLQAALRQLHAAIEGGVFPRFPELASLRLKVPRGAADIRLIVTAMREFERTAPSPQQTRTKSAREMVGHFAWQLEEALKSAALPPEGRQPEEFETRIRRIAAETNSEHAVTFAEHLLAEGRQEPEEAKRYAPDMNEYDHKPTCAIRTSRDGWDADCTCGAEGRAPTETRQD